MIISKEKATRGMSLFMLGLMLVFGCVFLAPTTSYATESNQEDSTQASSESEKNDLNNVKVSIGDNGELKVDGITDGNTANTWNTIFNKSKLFVIGFSGLATIVFIGLFVKNFVALGAASNNPQGRNQALVGCLWTGLAAAGCGSVTLLVGLFWNAFK